MGKSIFQKFRGSKPHGGSGAILKILGGLSLKGEFKNSGGGNPRDPMTHTRPDACALGQSRSVCLQSI